MAAVEGFRKIEDGYVVGNETFLGEDFDADLEAVVAEAVKRRRTRHSLVDHRGRYVVVVDSPYDEGVNHFEDWLDPDTIAAWEDWIDRVHAARCALAEASRFAEGAVEGAVGPRRDERVVGHG